MKIGSSGFIISLDASVNRLTSPIISTLPRTASRQVGCLEGETARGLLAVGIGRSEDAGTFRSSGSDLIVRSFREEIRDVPSDGPRQLDYDFIFDCEGGAAGNTEFERVSGRLLVFRTALSALDFRQFIPHSFDDSSRLIQAGIVPAERIRTPRAEIVGLKFPLRERKQTSAAKSRLLLGAPQICKHLGTKCQQNAQGLFSRIPHKGILPNRGN
jgi:hypothetical protein